MQKISLKTSGQISTCSKTDKGKKEEENIQIGLRLKEENKETLVKGNKNSSTEENNSRKNSQNSSKTASKQKSEDSSIKEEKLLERANTRSKNTKSEKKKAKTFQELTTNGYSQNMFSFIKELYGGLIVTKNNRYISIMEIIPSNFEEQNQDEQIRILDNYKRMMTIAPRSSHLKCITQKTDDSTIINNIQKASQGMESEARRKIRQNYIKHVKSMSQRETIQYRYFYIFEYEGNEFGIKATDRDAVYMEMEGKKKVFQDILEDGNNYIAVPEDPNMYTLEILYLLLNRNSYHSESLASRILRINHDCDMLNVEPDIVSYFAPKGMAFNYSKETHTADGLYYTYLCLLDTSYPSKIYPGWLNNIRAGIVNMDVDFFMDKQPYEMTKRRAARRKTWNIVSAKQTKNINRQEEYIEKAKTANYIEESMNAGDDVFDCCTVITLYGYDKELLLQQKANLRKEYQGSHLHTEDSYMDAEEYYLMTLPFLNFRNRLFKKNKRNMTTSALKNSYCFTKYSLFDQTYPSVVIGPAENGTLYALNRFNTNYYVNPHMTIVGASGSGKSYLEMGIGRRDTLMKLRTYYILPLKAFEYEDHCKELEGNYIRFGLQIDTIYNIMELFPPIVGKYEVKHIKKKSILSQKIISLCTWLRILSELDGDEKYKISTMDSNRIQDCLYELYRDFGFSDDDDSIWEDKEKGIKKAMPLISYWEERMRENALLEVYADLLLPFTKGVFSHYNQQSNIDFSKDVLVCNVEKDDIGEDMHPAIMYLAYDLCNNLIKADRTTLSSLFLDEVWNMMINDVIGKIIEEDIRLLRGYGCSVVCASQRIEEFADNKYGRAVISNSAIKILMAMEPNEINLVSKVIPLTSADRKFLLGCHPGEFLVVSKLYKFRCRFNASLEEAVVYNTDPVNQEILEKKLLQQNNMES